MAEIADLVIQLGRIGLWLSAVGAIVILWLIFQITNFFINRKRMKAIYHIKIDMKRMEDKLDKLLAKKK